jgi:preprotein translocase subunit Sss1
MIFVGGFCLGLIAFAIQLINSPISSLASEQQIQQSVGKGILILSFLGFILSLIYFVLNYRFYAKKDWGGIEINENQLSYRYFNHWRFIEKSLDISVLTNVFVHTHKSQACIQLTTNSPLQIIEIPCKHLSNEQLEILLFLLKKNQV